MVVSVDASTGSATAFVPSSAARNAIVTLALVAVDGLEHDDCVVDEATHGESQPAEREGVQRLARRVEDDERHRERERNRNGDDDRAAHALDEDQDDERDEDERLSDLALEPRICGLHVRRLVEDGLHDHPGGEIRRSATTFFAVSTISSVLPPGTRRMFK